ncbi:glycerophosphodiester phosphodiesterase [Maribacter sp. 2210JD10-5]|uniref:glycerophosphodiester phosphodiesterase n=1 Tax=Maribacter sp. 2210JD10-5 TaxID=3386272 RepID=UPI0039BC8C25
MKIVTLLIVIVLLCSCTSVKKKSDFADNVVVAHRGAWKDKGLPENSIAALRNAISLGCTGSEFDVRMTLDDVLIVTHDAEYNDLDIEATPFAELRKTPLANGEPLPTLQQYLLAGMENNTTTRLVCEIKPSKSKERSILIAEKVAQLIEELKAQEKVIYISFSYDILKRLEEIDPKVHTQYLDGSKTPDQLKTDGIDGADYYFSIFKKHPEWIVSARKKDISLNAWTINKETDIDWFLKKDFDFITTNEPELVLEKSK